MSVRNALAPAGRVLTGLVQRVVRSLVALMPRDPNRWVFGSRGDAYVDNPRYLFEYLVDRGVAPQSEGPDTPVRATWISGSPTTVDRIVADGRPARLRRSLRGSWEVLRAGVAVYAFDVSDINLALTGGAVGVNLYHGVPLKQIEDLVTVGSASRVYHPRTPIDRLRAATVYLARTVPNDVVLATSEEVADTMRRAFGARARSVVIGRPPRLGPATVAAQRRRTAAGDGPAVLLYAPTWREGGFQLDEALPHLEQLEAALAASDTQLLIKGHLYDRLALPRRSASISLVANDEELGAILGDVDGVITDYSSVMFDAALIGLPVIFYPFDLDRYRRLSSGTFMFDYDDLVSERVARSFDQLTEIVATGAWRTMVFPASIRNRVWGPETAVHNGPTDDAPAADPANRELVRQITELASDRHGRHRRGGRPGGDPASASGRR